MLILDTHIWHWWFNQIPDKLPASIVDLIETADEVAVSAISCFEMAWLVKHGRIDLGMPFEQWLSLNDNYLSLTDIARVRNPSALKMLKNWLRTRSTIEFLRLWEIINNPNLKGVEFDSFKQQAGSNSFTLSPNNSIDATGAIGLRSTAARNGGTYAHRPHQGARQTGLETGHQHSTASAGQDGRVPSV